MLPIQRKISAFNHYDYNNPKYIVMHYVGAQSSTAANNANYFAGGDRQASAHYFVDDNSIWQSVEDKCGAWHIGNTRTEVNNQNSIGIEMCCMGPNLLVTETTENNAVELCEYLMNKYNIPISNVRTHYEVSGGTKVCPNWSANNWSRWSNFKNKLNGNVAINNNENKEEMNYSMYIFSANWYLAKNKDVAGNATYKNDPYKHYEKYGKKEGRKPLPPIPVEYNEGDYLQLNKDVAAAVKKGTFTSGLHHYLMYGFNENRKVCKNDDTEAIKKRVEDLELKLEEIKKIVD